MSAVRRRQAEWWVDDDEQRTEVTPLRALRGATAVAPAVKGHAGGAVARPAPTAGRRAARAAAPAPAPARPLPDLSKIFGMVAAIGVLTLLLYLGITSLIGWTRVRLDDMHYGRPRTYQLDAFVGHNEANGTPTHFVALNLNRRVTIMEFPGGDVTKPQVIVGPYLFGRDEDLTVVKLSVEDVNGDGKPDLIAQVRDERLVYINDNGAFRPITSDELARLKSQEGGH
ncbi:MAG TPA: VCBS repeat-containing protein [Thermomicrobiales bacterium]|nr:VCBS repeat-containing protein [Thermomicrobiales bacterium]